MKKRNEFFNNFIRENPNFPRDFVYFYQSEKDGSCYAIVCNYKTNSCVSREKLREIENLPQDDNILTTLCENFKDDYKVIEKLSNFILETNNLTPKIEEILNYLAKPDENKTEPKLSKENVITAFKLDNNSKLTEEVCFRLNFSVDELKKGKQYQKRLFIENAESFERGKGIYTEILKNVIPNICINHKIPFVVLQASAFESDLSGKGGQEKLENFYRSNGFTKAIEKSAEDFVCLKFSDFDEGLPIYYKEIEQEQEKMALEF